MTPLISSYSWKGSHSETNQVCQYFVFANRHATCINEILRPITKLSRTVSIIIEKISNDIQRFCVPSTKDNYVINIKGTGIHITTPRSFGKINLVSGHKLSDPSTKDFFSKTKQNGGQLAPLSHPIGTIKIITLLSIEANGKSGRMEDSRYPITKIIIKTKAMQSFDDKRPTKSVKGLGNVNFQGNITTKKLLFKILISSELR